MEKEGEAFGRQKLAEPSHDSVWKVKEKKEFKEDM